jgi:hypothetical protein
VVQNFQFLEKTSKPTVDKPVPWQYVILHSIPLSST